MKNINANLKIVRNLKISGDQGILTVVIDPRIFSLKTVFQAAYMFMDRAYIIINGDPQKEITVELTSIEATDLEKLGNDFNNELLNYAVYNIQSGRTIELRKMIIGRALLGNIPDFLKAGLQKEKIKQEHNQDEDYKSDPLGIKIPWTEPSAAPIGTVSAQCQEGLAISCKTTSASASMSVSGDYEADPLGIKTPWKESQTSVSAASASCKECRPKDSECNIIATKHQKAGAKKRDGLASSYEISKNESNIEINLAIYPLDSVLLVSEEFKENFWVNLMKIQDNDTFISVSLRPKEKGLDLKASTKEFFNYLIGVKKDDAK